MIGIVLVGLTALVADMRLTPESSRSVNHELRHDTTLVRRIDVDGDGQPDEVKLHVQGASFDQPFATELTIVSKGHVILRNTEPAHGQFDDLFKFSDIIKGCSGFLQCKRKWYFELILENTVQSAATLGPGVFDPAQRNSIHAVASKYLVEHCKASADGAQQAVRNAVARVRASGAFVVVPQLSPVKAGMPQLWFPEYSCFAPIYEE